MYMYMSVVNVLKNKVKKVELNELGLKILLYFII